MYRVTLSCSGLTETEGAAAVEDIIEEFTHRPWHTNLNGRTVFSACRARTKLMKPDWLSLMSLVTQFPLVLTTRAEFTWRSSPLPVCSASQPNPPLEPMILYGLSPQHFRQRLSGIALAWQHL